MTASLDSTRDLIGKDPDIVLYFEEVRREHLHKYFLLNRELNKTCNSLLLIKRLGCEKENNYKASNDAHMGGGPLGIPLEYYKKYPKEYRDNSLLVFEQEAANIFQGLYSSNPNKKRLAVFGSGKFVNQNIVKGVGQQGFLTFQLPKLFGDFYYKGASIAIYINELHLKHDTAQGFHIHENIVFGNNFLYDRIGDGLPEKMSKDEFLSKYNLDPKKPVFLYSPTSISSLAADSNEQEIYNYITRKVDNLIIKLHPNEYARWKADRVGYKWSYNLYSDKNCYQAWDDSVPVESREVPVLDQIDTHWCYEYVDCGITFQSLTGIELGIYDTPAIYIDVENPKRQGTNSPWWEAVGGYKNYGIRCTLAELENVISDKKYIPEDRLELEEHKARYLKYPDTHGHVVTSNILNKYFNWYKNQ